MTPTREEIDGVCVGEHVPETIAMEAARRIKELEDKLEQVKFALEVESHDNSYNKDKYKDIVNSMADALKQAQTYICQTPSHFSAPYHNETTNKIIEALAKYEEMRK